MTQRRGGALIIGVGNTDRGDDGAGLAVAARLKARVSKDVRVMECGGEAAALVGLLGEVDDAILIDAAISGAAPGTVGRYEAHARALPAGRFGLSSHGFGLAEAIELARALGQLPRRCVVYAIEGRSFAAGEALSQAVEGAVERVAAHIMDEICEKAD